MPHKGGEIFCLYLSPFLYRVPLLPFQFRQYIRRDTVNQPLHIVQFAFQLCPLHAVFDFAAGGRPIGDLIVDVVRHTAARAASS